MNGEIETQVFFQKLSEPKNQSSMLICQANPAKYVQLMERKIEEFKEGANQGQAWRFFGRRYRLPKV